MYKSITLFIKISLCPTDIKKQFLQQPLSATIEAGRGVTFRCVPPPAAPPPTIKWTRNGVTIEPTDETLVLPKVGLQVNSLFWVY